MNVVEGTENGVGQFGICCGIRDSHRRMSTGRIGRVV
jgi:hypothetical protein